MDCDTTGIEPDFALVKFKKLAGGGYFKIINRSVPAALEKLGLQPPPEIEEIIAYPVGHGTHRQCARIKPHLARRPQGSGRGNSEKIRGGTAFGLRQSASCSTTGPWARKFCTGTLSNSGGES